MSLGRNEARSSSETGPIPQVPRSLIAFNAGYIALTSVAALIHENRELGLFAFQMAVLIGAVVLVHLRCNLKRGLLWCFSIWGLLHMAGGLVPIPQVWPFEGKRSSSEAAIATSRS